jgi:hypothetical protein
MNKHPLEITENQPAESGRAARLSVLGLVFVLAAVLALASLVSCGSLFGDRAQNKPVSMGGGELDCLSHVSSDVKSWTSTGTPGIDHPIDCMVMALDKFNERVRDRKTGEWTSVDVGRFLSDNLGRADGPQRLDALLKLKTAIFGGTATILTRTELLRVRGTLLKLKPEALSLSSRLDILKMQLSSPAPEQSELAAAGLKRLSGVLADEASTTQDRSSLTFEEIRAGLVALGVDADAISSWQPLMMSAKAILAGGAADSVAASEWPRLFRATGSVWGLVLRARYSMEGRGDLLGTDLGIVDTLLHDAVSEVDASIRAQSGQAIVVEKIDALIDALFAKALLPAKLTAVTAKGLVRPLLGKILYGNSREGQAQRMRALSLVHLTLLRSSIDDWLGAQNEIVQTTQAQSYSDSLVRLLSSTFAVPSDQSTTYRPALADLFSRGRPLVHDADGLYLIMPTQQLPDPSRADLDQTNLVRAFVTALVRGYSHDAAVAARAGGLSEDELQELYADARGLGTDLGIVDVRNTGAGKRSYMEARLFTSVPIPSRPDTSRDTELIDTHQAIEWFEMAISGNLTAAKLYERLLPTCGTNERDLHGARTLDIKCFRADFSKNFDTIVPNLPGFAAWIKADTTGERMKQVLFALEEAGRAPGATDDNLDEADARSLLPILYYTESLILTWDKNANGILDKEELWSFFPVIQPMLKRLGDGKADSEFMQKAIFSWILSKGEPPTTSILGGVELALWGLRATSVDLKASRLDILKVMSSLASFNRHGLNAKIADFVGSDSQLAAHLSSGDAGTVAMVRELFQCQPSSTADLSGLLQAHVGELVPRGRADAAVFTHGLKALLKSDPRFAAVCLPF